MNRWRRGGLIVLVAFAFTVLATWAEARHPICRDILLPGLAIADYWLHINFWQHPGVFLYLTIAVNTFTYSALFGLFLRLLRFIFGKA